MKQKASLSRQPVLRPQQSFFLGHASFLQHGICKSGTKSLVVLYYSFIYFKVAVGL